MTIFWEGVAHFFSVIFFHLKFFKRELNLSFFAIYIGSNIGRDKRIKVFRKIAQVLAGKACTATQ